MNSVQLDEAQSLQYLDGALSKYGSCVADFRHGITTATAAMARPTRSMTAEYKL